jgi:hypothetical protein
MTDSVNVARPPLLVENKRIFGIVPNNRTWPSPKDYKPLSTHEKVRDCPSVKTLSTAAWLSSLRRSRQPLSSPTLTPRLGKVRGEMPAILAHLTENFVIGNFMSEAIYPTLLHQNPRYFQRGIGSTRARLGPSIGQIFWTHTDSHRTQFNYSEILGNSIAVAISDVYYQDNRKRHRFCNKARRACASSACRSELIWCRTS